jgi:hypothetical protein
MKRDQRHQCADLGKKGLHTSQEVPESLSALCTAS